MTPEKQSSGCCERCDNDRRTMRTAISDGKTEYFPRCINEECQCHQPPRNVRECCDRCEIGVNRKGTIALECMHAFCSCHAPEKQNVALRRINERVSEAERSPFKALFSEPEDAPEKQNVANYRVCGEMSGKPFAHTWTDKPAEEKQNVATWNERLDDFAAINDFYLRGVPMGKLKAFLEVEIAAAKREALEAAKAALTTDDGCWTCMEIRKRLDDLSLTTNQQP